MKKKITNPKVFISYAWGTAEYNDSVIAFATDLKNDGVEVVLDRWQLKEGFDTYAFMEKSVTDPEITNVLILLDPTYAAKADKRSGGVGTETQIISAEVYNKVEQEKFIPVVFKRDEDGGICKPRYLKALLHFDLSQEEAYGDEYKRLVRRLYGIDTIKEPELGTPPAWLEEEPKSPYKTIVNESFFKKNLGSELQQLKLQELLEQVTSQMMESSYDSEKSDIEIYEEILPIRNEFLGCLRCSIYVKEGYKLVIATLEQWARMAHDFSKNPNPIAMTMVHELFIYVVAFYLKWKKDDALRYILNKTYFTGSSNYCSEADSYNSFYTYNQYLDGEMCKRDQKNYFSGTAAFWMSHIDIDTCRQQEFVFADVFCYSASYVIENYGRDSQWFPLSYVYCRNEQQSMMRDYALKLKSKEHLEQAAYVLGYDNCEEFKKKYAEVENGFLSGKYRVYRYNMTFNDAGAFWQWIKASDLGIMN